MTCVQVHDKTLLQNFLPNYISSVALDVKQKWTDTLSQGKERGGTCILPIPVVGTLSQSYHYGDRNGVIMAKQFIYESKYR